MNAIKRQWPMITQATSTSRQRPVQSAMVACWNALARRIRATWRRVRPGGCDHMALQMERLQSLAIPGRAWTAQEWSWHLAEWQSETKRLDAAWKRGELPLRRADG